MAAVVGVGLAFAAAAIGIFASKAGNTANVATGIIQAGDLIRQEMEESSSDDEEEKEYDDFDWYD